MVITNLVVALQIITTETVPCPCPDNDPGCIVLHQKQITSTRYELPKTDSDCMMNYGASWRGFGVDGFDCWAMNLKGFNKECEWIGCTNCIHVPVKAFKYCPECNQRIFSDDIIGLLNIRLVNKALEEIDSKCKHSGGKNVTSH